MSQTLNFKPSEDAMRDLHERVSETLDAMVGEFRRDPEGQAPWPVVPAARLKRIWSDAAKHGFVRDVRGLEAIERRFVENVVRLMVNTEVAAHGARSSAEVLEDRVEEDEIEKFVDWAIETPQGGWRISDYGLESLFALAAALNETDRPEDKLVILDAMLNVVHQRSDLASWFVEGGTKTLSDLADGERPATPPENGAPNFGR